MTQFTIYRYEKGAKTSDESKKLNECHYNQNKGYVVFSAMGSFFIPMTVMLYVYSRICCVLTSRHNIMTRTEVCDKNEKYFFESLELSK